MAGIDYNDIRPEGYKPRSAQELIDAVNKGVACGSEFLAKVAEQREAVASSLSMGDPQADMDGMTLAGNVASMDAAEERQAAGRQAEPCPGLAPEAELETEAEQPDIGI